MKTIEWRGAEEDGYTAEVCSSGGNRFVLYVSPLNLGLWSWSVTALSPMQNIRNHVDSCSAKASSNLAKAAAESAIREYLAT